MSENKDWYVVNDGSIALNEAFKIISGIKVITPCQFFVFSDTLDLRNGNKYFCATEINNLNQFTKITKQQVIEMANEKTKNDGIKSQIVTVEEQEKFLIKNGWTLSKNVSNVVDGWYKVPFQDG